MFTYCFELTGTGPIPLVISVLGKRERGGGREQAGDGGGGGGRGGGEGVSQGCTDPQCLVDLRNTYLIFSGLR